MVDRWSNFSIYTTDGAYITNGTCGTCTAFIFLTSTLSRPPITIASLPTPLFHIQYLHCLPPTYDLLPTTQHPVASAQCPVPSNYYIHPITDYPLPTSQSTTHHLLPAAYYSQRPPTIHYPLPATGYLLPRTYYLLLATYYLQSDELPSANLLVVGQ